MRRSFVSPLLVSLACLGLVACPSGETDDGNFTFTTSAADDFGTTDDTTTQSETGTSDADADAGGDCGNGTVEAGEECDLGADNSDAGACTTSCTIAACGDGNVYEGVEECDDGNQANDDACVQGCKIASCGDGFVQAGVEMCDDGNDDPADGCNSMCLPGVCGDGILQDGEQCDDGNGDTSDMCPACQLAFCGDGFTQAGIEVCDDGNLDNDDGCIAPLCVPATCGDGHIQAGVETCDDGNSNDDDGCPGSCAPAFCGDGYVQEGVEECDDGNDVPDDTCTNECIALCGDDCWGEFGCFTPAGRCVKFSCRAGNAGPNFCDSCMGWQEITYDQWMNQGYCGDIIQTYRNNYGTQTRCGAAASCCADEASCGGGDNAWHFHDGVQNHYVGPCLGCANDINCSYWNGVDNGTYTRITACERG